jgi:hypothetical protein
MQNAPVSLSSASPEAQFATSASCADRTAALTVTLDANGNAPPTWVCFSDVGSTAGIALISTSGQLATSQTGAGTVTLTVDPEPAAIAVTAINPVAFVGSAQGLFNVSAFDVLANRLAISVQCQFQGTAEALLQGGIVPLQTAQPTAVGANLLTPGTLTLTVSPELAPSISCPSPSIMVQPDSDGGL